MRQRQDSIIDGVAIDEGLCTWDVLDGWEAATRSARLRVGEVKGAYEHRRLCDLYYGDGG